jgi:hypothetical protein
MSTTAHHIITGTDKNGQPFTEYTEGDYSLFEAAELALNLIHDGCQQAFVYRAEPFAVNEPPRLVEVTADAANLVFGKWLEEYGAYVDEHDIPAWFETQLERLCINAENERRDFNLGYRHGHVEAA